MEFKEQIDILTKEINELNGRVEKAVEAGNETATKQEVSKLSERLDALAKARDRANSGNDPVFGNKAVRKEFGDWLFDGPIAGMNQVAKVGTVGSDTAGGHLVPEQFSDAFTNLLTRSSVALDRHDVVQLNPATKSMEFMKITGGITTEWQATEDTGLTPSDPAYGVTVLTPKTLAALHYASNKLIHESRFEVATIVAQEMARAAGVAIDTQVFTGTGSPITGYEASGDVQEVDIDAAGAQSIASALASNASNKGFNLILDLMAAVTEGTYQQANDLAFYMNRKTLFAMKKIKDSQNQFVWQGDVSSSPYGTLMGYPVIIVPSMANALDTSGGSEAKMYVGFGSCRLAGKAVTNRNMNVDVSPHYLFNKGQTAFRLTMDFDFKVHEGGAFARLVG